MESKKWVSSSHQNSMMIEDSQFEVDPVLTDNLPKTSMSIYCPKCHRHGMTKITLQNGVLTWLGCSAVFLSGCILGCCVVPFFTPYLKDIVHECGICGHKIGLCFRL